MLGPGEVRQLAARLDELIAEPSPTLPEVERVLGRLLDSR